VQIDQKKKQLSKNDLIAAGVARGSGMSFDYSTSQVGTGGFGAQRPVEELERDLLSKDNFKQLRKELNLSEDELLALDDQYPDISIREMEALALLNLLCCESEQAALANKHLLVSVDNADVVWALVKSRHKSTRLTKLLLLID